METPELPKPGLPPGVDQLLPMIQSDSAPLVAGHAHRLLKRIEEHHRVKEVPNPVMKSINSKVTSFRVIDLARVATASALSH